jgi:hypothetical protein
MDAKKYSGKHSLVAPLHNPMTVTPGARGQVLKILTNIANTDQYCYLAVVVKDVFIHKEEAEGDSASNDQRVTSNEQLFPARGDRY